MNKLATTLTKLGEFETSGEVYITDPCYRKTVVDATKVVPGKYDCLVLVHTYGARDERCAQFEVILKSYKGAINWILQKDNVVSVDSGQAGVFDSRSFTNPKFYDTCCDLTLTTMGGVLDGGFVTSSGWGDGGYPLYLAYNEAGDIVGIKVVFIGDDDLDEDESFWS